MMRIVGVVVIAVTVGAFVILIAASLWAGRSELNGRDGLS